MFKVSLNSAFISVKVVKKVECELNLEFPVSAGTGNTVIEAVRVLIEHGVQPKHIILLSLFSTPHGIPLPVYFHLSTRPLSWSPVSSPLLSLCSLTVCIKQLELC